MAREHDGYIPALDGLRAVSVLLVFFSHAELHRIIPGGLGVVVFFVISGFLITRQMIAEVERTGTLNIGRFYLRRFFRLAPALFLYIGLFSCLLSALGAVITPAQVASGVFFFANYYGIFTGYPAHSPFPILWSLAVEEHYYLVFPFCILAFRHHLKKLLPCLCVAVIGVFLWRYHVTSLCGTSPLASACGLPDSDRIFHGTDTIADSILYGAIAAFCLHYYPDAFRRRFIHSTAFLLAGLILLGTLLWRDALFRETLRFSLQPAAIAVILANIVLGDGLAKIADRFLSLAPLRLLGRMSYSLYLFHYGVLCVLSITLGIPPLPFTVMASVLYLTTSALYTSASYFLAECPFMAIRRRLRKEPRS